MADQHRRSIVKALTWRGLGTVDTFVLSFIITGNATIAFSISGLELFTKVALFWLHERVWNRIPWGRQG